MHIFKYYNIYVFLQLTTNIEQLFPAEIMYSHVYFVLILNSDSFNCSCILICVSLKVKLENKAAYTIMSKNRRIISSVA